MDFVTLPPDPRVGQDTGDMAAVAQQMEQHAEWIGVAPFLEEDLASGYVRVLQAAGMPEGLGSLFMRLRRSPGGGA